MNVPRQIFREYDIRGVAERDLTDDLARNVGLGLGKMLVPQEGPNAGKAPRLAVARDCRLSSPRLHAALLDGLRGAGVHVVDAGVGPTPMLYFAVHHLDADGGVMITGSHNPGDENGFKIMKGKGSFYGKDIQDLRGHIEGGLTPSGPQGSYESVNLEAAYVAALTRNFNFPKKPLPFVLDAGNGAGGPLGLKAMRTLGLEPDPLYCDMDGTFPHHHPDPTVAKNLVELIARVKHTGSRVGLAFDGDADRLGAVDANGDIIWGDKLMILFSRALLRKHPGAAILGEVKCSQTLYDDIAKHGGRPIIWKTGHSLIRPR